MHCFDGLLVPGGLARWQGVWRVDHKAERERFEGCKEETTSGQWWWWWRSWWWWVPSAASHKSV